jgi:hypothetical protein
MKSLIEFDIPSIQFFKPCDRETMLVLALDKTKNAAAARSVTTMEAVVCMQRAGLVLERFFGLNERIAQKWQDVARKMLYFELEVTKLNPRFGENNSALFLFDLMVTQLSIVATAKNSTNEDVEAAIDGFDVGRTIPWVVEALQELAIIDISRMYSDSSGHRKRSIATSTPDEHSEHAREEVSYSSELHH